MAWTDIHSHILPGFDDGANSQEEFLAMARVAVEGHTSRMAATPHYDNECPGFGPTDVTDVVERHNSLLSEKGIPLSLVFGMELMINAGLLRLVKKGVGLEGFCLGENGKYVLIELPLVDMPLPTFDIIFHIQLHGMIPILAHPERNRYLIKHPSAVKEIIERGAEMQVNSGSLQGLFGKSARRMARSLLVENASKLVASDAHGSRVRTPDLSGAAEHISALLGEKNTDLILGVNPERVLAGEELVDVTSAPKEHCGKSWQMFWRRYR